MDGNKNITPVFQQLGPYTLTVNEPACGEVTVDPELAEYPCGSEVILTAIGDACCVFDHWEGDVPAGHEQDNPLTLVMDGNKNITPVFQQLGPYTLTVIVDPPAGGTVTVDPDLPQYPCGTEVTLTANDNAGYDFDHWSGDAAGSNPQVVIVMDGNKTVTAHFILEPPPQACKVRGSGVLPEPGRRRATLYVNVEKNPAGEIVKDKLRFTRIRPRQLIVSTGVATVECNGAGTAVITGTCTLNRVAGYTYTVTVVDNAPDSFTVVVKQGAATVVEIGGNITRGDFAVTGGGIPAAE